nr:reactive oxygen species modulator 1 isoform X1 [Pogona vitticeps]XP_020638099.1 reactive oxygen species modulator 1 isoform X2 [Pogona vitticeps]
MGSLIGGDDGSLGAVAIQPSPHHHRKMPVTVGPYGQSQPSCFDRVKMGFMMGFAVGMAAGALFGTFSCLRIGMRGRELMGGVGKTMMQSGGTFGTFMAIGMGIRC